MLFNSIDYAVFLIVALLGYWLLPNSARRIWILALSVTFYMAWEPWYVLLLLGSSLSDWFFATQIAVNRVTRPEGAKLWLGLSVVLNLGLLAYFKYAAFAWDVHNQVRQAAGLASLGPGPSIILPVAISFYTFESMSYCVDVYRGHTRPAKNPLDLLFFISFFPKLVAGPIARPSDLLPQLEQSPRLSPKQVGDAVFLIGMGLTKKIVLADHVSINLVDRVFDTPSGYTTSEVIIALYGFTLQIYADFSGYTDIARGSAKLFGIELPENFDRPYQATNPADFWRRWHMTLSTWIRDYVYFPLGGSQHGAGRTYFNLWLTIFLIGLWHGASWNFVMYGSIQATAVVLHRLWSKSRQAASANEATYRGKTEPRTAHVAVTILSIAMTMQLVVFSRILFRAENLENAGEIVAQLTTRTWSTANVPASVWMVLIVGFGAHYTPKRWLTATRERFVLAPFWLQGILIGVLLVALAAFSGGQTAPYVYFQF